MCFCLKSLKLHRLVCVCMCESFDGHNKNDSVRIVFHVFMPMPGTLFFQFRLCSSRNEYVSSTMRCRRCRRCSCSIVVWLGVAVVACLRVCVGVSVILCVRASAQPLCAHIVCAHQPSASPHTFTAISNCFDYYYFSLASEIQQYYASERWSTPSYRHLFI